MAKITNARSALWKAIDNWGELQDVFSLKVKTDDQIEHFFRQRGPSPGDIPAIAILSPSIAPEWFVNEMQKWPTTFATILYIDIRRYSQAEDLIEKVVNAVYRATPDGSTVPYVKASAGIHPQRIGPISINLISDADGNPMHIRATINFILSPQKDPFQ